MNRPVTTVLIASLLILCSLNALSQQVPQTSIYGRITDEETGLPMIGANVYIANTVLGSATNDNGEFIIFKVPHGVHRLIAAYIGYEIKNIEITITGPQKAPINIALKTDPLQSGEVVVTGERPKNWGYNLHRFKEFFLGTSENAKMCTILNPEVLEFEEPSSHKLIATATGLLKIENRALGYYIELQLEEFWLEHDQLFISYYPHYTDLDPENIDQIREWENERKRAYNGSLRHFLKYLIMNYSTEDESQPIFNSIDHAIQYFNDKNWEFSKTYKENDFIYRNVDKFDFEENPYSHDDKIDLAFMDTQVQYEKELYFRDMLHIIYWHEPIEREYYDKIQKSMLLSSMLYDPTRNPAKQKLYQTTFLKIHREPVIVNMNGVLQNPYSLRSYGYMAWESLADLVPIDYDPAPESKEVFPVDFRPETKWFRAMDNADTTKFREEFEYPLLLVLDETERKHYNGIRTAEGRKGFIKRYIKSRNQNPLYAVNYWFLEYIGRYEHARDEFAAQDFPYFDKRGEFWIKYGKPDSRFEDGGGLKRSQALSQEVEYKSHPEALNGDFQPFVQIYSLMGKRIPDVYYSVRRNESWHYRNDKQRFTVHFLRQGKGWRVIDRLDKALNVSGDEFRTWGWMELVKERDHISNEYLELSNTIMHVEEKLAMATVYTRGRLSGIVNLVVPGDLTGEFNLNQLFGNTDIEKFQNESTERTEVRFAEPNIDDRFKDQNALDIDYVTAQFRGENGKTRIELTALTPIDELLSKRIRQDSSASISASVQVVVRDSTFDQLTKVEDEYVINKSTAEKSGIGNIIGYCTVEVEPQTGDLTVQMQDNASRNRGFRQQLLEIKDFSGQEPMISDIMFYSERGETSSLPSVSVDGMSVAPYPDSELKQSKPVFCYFELYNMNSPGFGPVCEIELKTDSKKSRFGFLKKLFGGSGRIQLSVSQTRTFTEKDSRELIAVDISQLKPGEYTFTVSVTSQGVSKTKLNSERKIVIAK